MMASRSTDQRYYNSASGRFLSPDPYMASGGPADPQSWNRYAYVGNDPVNFADPEGLLRAPIVGGVVNFFRSHSGFGENSAPDLSVDFGPPTPPPDVAPPRFSNTEMAEQYLPAVLARAIQALTLNSDCMKLFGNEKTREGEFNPVTVITDLVSSGLTGGKGQHGQLTWQAGADSSVKANGIPYLTSSATIRMGLTSWNVGNIDYNAHTLLHELGHLYDVVRGSGGSTLKTPDALLSDKDSKWNDWKVDQDCFGGSLGYKKP